MKKYFHVQKSMRVNAELQVLDEPVRPFIAAGLTGQETGLTDLSSRNDGSATKVDENIKVKHEDWRAPIVFYLKDSGHGAKRNIRRMPFKYGLIDGGLYYRTGQDLLLQFTFGSGQSCHGRGS